LAYALGNQGIHDPKLITPTVEPMLREVQDVLIRDI
jgi:hypothetical protein